MSAHRVHETLNQDQDPSTYPRCLTRPKKSKSKTINLIFIKRRSSESKHCHARNHAHVKSELSLGCWDERECSATGEKGQLAAREDNPQISEICRSFLISGGFSSGRQGNALNARVGLQQNISRRKTPFRGHNQIVNAANLNALKLGKPP